MALIQQQQYQLHHKTHLPTSLPGQIGVNTAAAASMHQLHHQTPSPASLFLDSLALIQQQQCINFIIRHLRQHLSLDSLALIQQQQQHQCINFIIRHLRHPRDTVDSQRTVEVARRGLSSPPRTTSARQWSLRLNGGTKRFVKSAWSICWTM